MSDIKLKYTWINTLRDLVFYLPILIVTACLTLRLSDWWMYAWLLGEDGPLEMLQFLLFLSSGLMSFYLLTVLLRIGSPLLALYYLCAGLAFLFIAGEEISWGQRIFNLELPAFFQKNNIQNEVTLHNLVGYRTLLHSSYVVIGVAAAFLWLIMPAWVKAKYSSGVRLMLPGPTLGYYFLPVAVFYVAFDHFAFPLLFRFDLWMICWQDQELFEFLMALGFFFFVCRNAFPDLFLRLDPAQENPINNSTELED